MGKKMKDVKDISQEEIKNALDLVKMKTDTEKGLIDDFESINDITYQEILANLMDASHDLELKTRIHKPANFTSLFLLSVYFEKIGYSMSANILKSYIDYFYKVMISYNGLGRSEMIRAVSGRLVLEEDSPVNLMSRLTTNLAKKTTS